MKRLANKPFALLGINSDRDREQLKVTVEQEEIIWRSWWDGGSTEGPIATKWNVMGWPAVYVLDHRGVIRGKELVGTGLDKLIDRLVGEADKDATSK